LGNFGEAAKPYIPEIAKLFQDPKQDAFIRRSAAFALSNFGEAAKPYIPDILQFIQDPQQGLDVRRIAANGLSKFGEAAKPYIPEIAKLFQDPKQDAFIRRSAAFALSDFGEVAKPHIPDILKLIQDPEQDSFVRLSAADVLSRFGEAAKPYIPDILKLIQDPKQDSSVRLSAADVLGELDKLSVENVVAVLSPTYEEKSEVDRWRFHAYFLSGGDEDVKRLLKWIAKPQQLPEKLEHDEGVKTLEASKKAWDAAKDYPELRDDLADKIALIARKVTWKPADLVLLKQHQDSLKTSHPANANTVQAVIVPLEGWQSLFSARNLILAHAAFWFALIFFYPKSPQIQAIFFWNPWMRNILGFPYVTFLLTWVPFLRHKLFEPFRLPLLADAGLDHFQPDRYFPYFDVIPKGSDEIQPLTQALPRIQGQVILEGESGLGKTMFLRQLLQRSRRISVYLPATKCSEGVIEAIQQKLHGDEIKDPKFLQSLIYSGAIDICIDGLNEVNPNTLAKITQFVENHAKANILLTTQPLEWTPPGMAKTYVLQPLQPDQIERYLISRQPLLAKTAPIHGPAYEQACRRFLEQTIGRQSRLSPEEQKTAQAILSNPMELSIAAALIAANTEPNLFNLREQQYTLMAADFQRLHNRPFPLKKFSEAIYQRWLTDQKTLPAADFYDEICCMEDEQFRMVVSRQPQTVKGEAQKDWYFRHDKIAEFFLVQTFLGDSDTAKSRLTQHLSDTPFRGVYFLLATLLPLDAAQQLREDLIQHAADTKDHTVSDTFIQLLRSR
jgi:HEAT repeat protein